jgi:hypothetical protein
MDGESVGAAISIMKGMPNNAAYSAAQAAESAELARDYADAVDAGTVEETLAYMDIEGSTEPADEVTVSGSNPVIRAAKNTYYVCGKLQTLNFTPNAKGICAVRFTSGTTATVLTVPNTVKWPDWFDGTVEVNRVYEISILDGVYGGVMSWA